LIPEAVEVHDRDRDAAAVPAAVVAARRLIIAPALALRASQANSLANRPTSPPPSTGARRAVAGRDRCRLGQGGDRRARRAPPSARTESAAEPDEGRAVGVEQRPSVGCESRATIRSAPVAQIGRAISSCRPCPDPTFAWRRRQRARGAPAADEARTSGAARTVSPRSPRRLRSAREPGQPVVDRAASSSQRLGAARAHWHVVGWRYRASAPAALRRGAREQPAGEGRAWWPGSTVST
jgi:hypothetical protein